MYRFILIVLLFILACNSSPNNSPAKDVAKDSAGSLETKNISSVDGCYISILKKDTAILKITNEHGKLMGSLVYKRFQKDSNDGTINGIFQDSLIIADYTFQSEGVTSVRQVVFKLSANTLLEGYGDINMNGDTARFKEISQLKYLDEQPFVKGECN